MEESAPVSITATPKENQLVEHEGRLYRTIREGLAYILVPPNIKTQQDPKAKSEAADESHLQDQKVFYNPIQQFNRDLSVLAIKAFGEDLVERRLPRWERTRERFAAKKEKRREKRKRDGDVTAGEPVKIQRLNGDDVDEAQAAQNGSQVTDGHTGVHAQDQEEAVARETSTSSTTGENDIEKATKGDVEPASKSSTNSAQPEQNQPSSAADEKRRSQLPFRILDALSATGLRALRYAQEIPFATSITANDMDSKAVESIRLHLQHNDLTSKITPLNNNAIGHMYTVAHPPVASHGPTHVNNKYDVIDLDPYGTAGPFIDAALQALNDGGLLCVTCTDSGVFASAGYSEKTFSLYGGLPVKGNHNHEVGLRLIAHSVATAGARYGIAIEPLLSLSIDFYARLFIRIRRSPADVKFLASKTMISYECDSGCGAWTTQLFGKATEQAGSGENTFWKYGIAQAPSADRECQHCGSKTHMAGPMWAGPLHNPAFIVKILNDVKKVDKSVYQTTPRIEGMLDTALDELFLEQDCYSQDKRSPTSVPKLRPELIDRTPFFFLPSAASKAIKCQAPPEAAVKGALRHAGYHVSRSHCKPGSIKTNASWAAIWEVFRQWVIQKRPVKIENIRQGSAAWALLRLGDSSEAQREQCATTAAGKGGDSSKDAAVIKNGDETGMMVVIFDEALGKDANGKKLVRYQVNPRENWGPMARAH